MKANRTRRTLALVAALAAVMVITVAAATMLLTPKDVARGLSDPTLADAFDSAGAIEINQTVESGGYSMTLAGLVSGAGLSDYTQDVDEERTYVVVSLAKADGSPLEEHVSDMVFTPLVAGFKPWQVNAWTLGGGYGSFIQDGVAYYIFDCQSLEMFADHTVYMALYQGATPSADNFSMAENGDLSFTDQQEEPRALFTLPLDPARADPAAAQQFLDDCGIATRD